MFTITSAIRQYLLEISASCNNVNFVKWKWNHFVIGSGRIDVYKNTTQNAPWIRGTTGSALAAASDIHWQVPTYMAYIRCDWLTNQNTDWCFVSIGLVGRQSHSPLLQLKIDPVRQMGPPYWLAPSGCQRIFINICGQYGIQKNIYIHP